MNRVDAVIEQPGGPSMRCVSCFTGIRTWKVLCRK